MKTSAPLASALLTLAALIHPAAAQAAEYQLLVHETPTELAKRSDSGPAGQAYWAAYAQAGAAMQAAGVMRGGGALQAVPATRVTAAAAGGQTLPKSGPRQLGGWFVIDVASAEAAARWAAKLPAIGTGGAVEIRPLQVVPGMAPAR